MKKNIANLAALILIVITSCQKEPSVDLPSVTNKVKTYTEAITSSSIGNSVTTYNLTYDANNRIISMVSAADPGNKVVYTYASANTILSDLYAGAVLGIHYEGYYNNNRLDSVFQYNDTGDSSTEKHIYNSAGYLVTSYEYNYSKLSGSVLENTIQNTYDASGNQLKSEGTDTNVETYEYYEDKVYVHPMIGPAIIPVVKHNLIKTHSVTSNGFPAGTETITYTFDSNDRISTETSTIDDGSVVVKTYTYF
jgi:hypothetical protein